MGLEIQTVHGSLQTSSYLGRTEGLEPSFSLFGLHRHCDGEISLVKPLPLSYFTAPVISHRGLIRARSGWKSSCLSRPC